MRLLSAGLFVFTILVWGAVSKVTGQTSVPPVPQLDHFKCYLTTDKAVNKSVVLHDRFGTSPARVLKPVRFCNPADKSHGNYNSGISNPDAHLKIYKLKTGKERSPKTAVVANQFGTLQTLKVVRPDVLAVPTQKLPHNPPVNLDHYKGYRVRGTSINATVRLKDQFNITTTMPLEAVVVMKPVWLLNPADKEHNQVLTRAMYPNQHLVCYTITPQNIQKTVEVDNQFGKEKLDLKLSDILCVPSILF